MTSRSNADRRPLPGYARDLTAAIKAKRHEAAPSLANQVRGLVLVLFTSDLVMLCLAFYAAYWFRFRLGVPVFEAVAADSMFYLRISGAMIPFWLVLLGLAGGYRMEKLLGGTREYALVFNAFTVGLVVATFMMFLDPEFDLARGWLLSAWLMAFLMVAGARFTIRRVVYQLRGRGWFLTPALIVGTNDEAVALARQLRQGQYSGLNILGFVSPSRDSEARVHRNLFSLGALTEIDRIVDQLDIQELVVATSAIRRDDLVELFRKFGGVDGPRMRLSGGMFEILTTRLEVRQLAFVSLLDVAPVRLRGIDVMLKAALDYTVATAALVAVAPILPIIWLTVRIDSPGPAIHRRRVLGLGGEPFDAFKFRTMVTGADDILQREPALRRALALNEKVEDDPRVTRVGRFLRRTSLDELPQLFNVLRGEMSVVGPRMISPGEHQRYGDWDMNLLTVRPGITGLWQVSGRSDIAYSDRVRLDMNYIRNWTIWLDLQILLQTIPAVLFGRGAY